MEDGLHGRQPQLKLHLIAVNHQSIFGSNDISHQIKYKSGIQLSIFAQPLQASQHRPKLGTVQLSVIALLCIGLLRCR